MNETNTDLSAVAYPCLTRYEEILIESGYTLHDITVLRRESTEH